MSRAWKLALLFLILFLLLAGFTAGQEQKPAFTANDKTLIQTYYDHLIGTLAPGSLDRTPFALGVEKALVPGSHVPMQLEKNLEPLPAKLEAKLTPLTGDYARYTLGRHVVLVKKGDLEIADILKDVAVKEAPRS
jgi:hypothetical protein